MVKAPKKRVRRKEAAAVETEPDAWERFRGAVGKFVPPEKPAAKKETSTT